MSHKPGHRSEWENWSNRAQNTRSGLTYEHWKEQSRQSDRAWGLRKGQIIQHAKQFRDSIGKGTPNDYLNFGARMESLLPSLFSQDSMNLYRSPRSRKWLGGLMNKLQLAIYSARKRENIRSKDMVSPKQILKGFRAIAQEEKRHREKMKKQEEAMARRELHKRHNIQPASTQKGQHYASVKEYFDQ